MSICYGIITEHGGSIRVRTHHLEELASPIEIPARRLAAEKSEEAPKSAASGETGENSSG